VITLLSILFLGFFLGLKHATDADHVIAVTTIVSRQRSVEARP
jgi:high-affinity nickel-transport protein